MADQIQELIEVPSDFAKSGIQFMRRCTKPDRTEFLRLCQAVGVGLLVMGSVGYVVKLVHIPLNNALL
jgi:protein transport protein SEC61 subunit gamma-like protein